MANNGTKITVLKHVDDLVVVLLASSADALQAGLESSESNCSANKLNCQYWQK